MNKQIIIVRPFNNSPDSGRKFVASLGSSPGEGMSIERRSSLAVLFYPQERQRTLAEIRRPLDRVNEVVDWEMFRPVLEQKLEYAKSPGPGRLAKDSVLMLMLKMCLLEDLHGLSDEKTEF